MGRLREHQKAGRRKRILQAARTHFLRDGYSAATMDAIAHTAGLSAVTIFNHYKSKGGLLLAIVTESDRSLVEKIEALLEHPPGEPADAVTAFSNIIFDHAVSCLDRKAWRHVLANAVTDGGSDFGPGSAALGRELIQLMIRLLDQRKADGRLDRRCDCAIAGEVLYNLHHARFVQFMADSGIDRERIEALTRRDLTFVVERYRAA